MSKQIYLVTANHPHPDWRLDKAAVEVGHQRYAVGDGEPTDRYSAWLPKFGYVCDHPSPEAAISDLLRANGCTNIRSEAAA